MHKFAFLLMNNEGIPVDFSSSALIRLAEMAKNIGLQEGQGLRIGSRGGGCGPQSYFLAFDFSDTNDRIFELDHFKVFINKAHSMHLLGLKVDFEVYDNEQGFVFKSNPSLK